ncbi:D-hydantoinase [Klebsiella spallanzanii]|uniref:D-hydantoinase n=1 Tax=Klebsiella spallanzanii TaxID=2587528 RepID=A0ABY6VEQ9_9ENTR|nr:dihydropyrimidinase [Klebsiella spallanzanii]MDM4206441.1 dihydropyrimidinase [Klebsiella spallanzanii]VUS64914.1 D-hydantoinase [Klebsiella spallanzanii]
MQPFDTVIRRARVVTAADIFTSDIGIIDGRIAALGMELPPGKCEIDAAGRYVTPGGIDSHVHLDQPSEDGAVMADDFLSGTLSAACGGTTTVIPFACQQKGGSLREAVEDYHRRVGDKPVIDYAFHLIVTDPTPDVLENELPALIAEGYTSFKIYMTYDALKLGDRQILETLSLARREGAMVMLHAENSDCIAWLTDRLLAAGLHAPRYHAVARPMLVEREATHRAIAFAELVDVPILIVHVSGREAVEQVRWAQSQGLKVYAETCPQYLFLTANDLGCDDSFEGARCICSPPPRDAANQQVIWDGLENGAFEIFSSDHAPYRFEGPDGKKAHGEQASFDKIANGIPGVETRMALLWSEGVRTGRITPQTFVALTSTHAAELYGLYPRKGSIAIGADADLVIWDDDRVFTLTNDMLHHNVDYTPYAGMQLSSWPAMTFSRGDIVWDGEPRGEQGRGQFLACERPGPAQIRRRKSELPL